MYSHRERRSEELFFGWLPLPWRVLIFELRLAAHQAGIDLEKSCFTFHKITVDELRESLGSKCLSKIEQEGPVVFEDSEGRAQCTAMAMMFRLGLEESWATPAFGPDADAEYLPSHLSGWFLLCICAVVFLPFIVVHGIQKDSRPYDDWGIVCTVLSTIFNLQFGGIAPQVLIPTRTLIPNSSLFLFLVNSDDE